MKYCKTCRNMPENCTCPKKVDTFDYTLKGEDIAGFDTCGYILKDGSYHMLSGQVVKELPKELELLGRVYTLEEVEKFKQSTHQLSRAPKDAVFFFNALYV